MSPDSLSPEPLAMPPADSRARARALLMGLQDSICAGLQQLDGEGSFQEESWERPEGGGGGCAGRTAVAICGNEGWLRIDCLGTCAGGTGPSACGG